MSSLTLLISVPNYGVRLIWWMSWTTSAGYTGSGIWHRLRGNGTIYQSRCPRHRCARTHRTDWYQRAVKKNGCKFSSPARAPLLKKLISTANSRAFQVKAPVRTDVRPNMFPTLRPSHLSSLATIHPLSTLLLPFLREKPRRRPQITYRRRSKQTGFRHRRRPRRGA